MIYVFANSGTEATRFSIRARLKGVVFVLSPDQNVTFNDEDEVFILENTSLELRKLANDRRSRSLTPPHLFKEVSGLIPV